MTSREQVLAQLHKILSVQKTYFILVPAITFGLGSLVHWIQKWGESNPKYSISEMCSVCYSQNRSIVFDPCRHLVLCQKCADSVEKCPICRTPIARKTPIGNFISQ